MSNARPLSAVALLATGFILFFSDRMARGRKNGADCHCEGRAAGGRAPRRFATLPGISRSGITICRGDGRWGYDRKFAVRFSFLHVPACCASGPPCWS